jgi:FtsX-like permease family/MacB-like periplasmic core domain
MMAFLRDLTYGWRSLRRAPWYALSVTGVLAVGIALTTVAFAVTDGVLFKPLPFLHAGELYLVRADATAAPRIEPPAVSWREVRAWTDAAPDLGVTVVSRSGVLGASIDERFFEVVGRPPLLGGFVPADFDWLAVSEQTGQRITPVLLTYEYWLREFGGDPSVVGRTIIRTSRAEFVSGIRIAGVLARDFVFPLDLDQEPPEMLSPIPREFRANKWPDRSAIGRQLLPRFSKSAPAMTVIGVVSDARYLALDADPIGDIYLPYFTEPGRYGAYFHVRTKGPADAVLGSVLAALGGRGYLLEQASTHTDALFASVKHRALPAWLFGSLGIGAIVVLATGIFGLLAMSAAQRTREVGIRIALGATRTRVVGLLVREQASPILLGLAAGALLSAWGMKLLESQLYGIEAHDLTVWSVVALTIGLVALVATVVPALKAVRANPIAALRTE